jgi:hypothetical protein
MATPASPPPGTYASPSTTPVAPAYSSPPVPGAAVPVPTLSSPALLPGYPAYGVVPWQATEGRLSAIGVGVKAYRDKHRTMPPAYLADKQGKPLLSWRVALLPYLGQQDLYKRFHLDESWDGAHNRQLIPLIPQVYQDPEAPDRYATPAKDAAGKTTFLLLRGPKTIYADPAPPMPQTFEEWLKIIVVVVAQNRSVPWTKPEEFTYEVKDPRAGTAGAKSGTDHMLNACGEVFGDGLPRFSPGMEESDRNTLRSLFTGEVVPLVAIGSGSSPVASPSSPGPAPPSPYPPASASPPSPPSPPSAPVLQAPKQ